MRWHLNLLTVAVRDGYEGLTALFSLKQLISEHETFPVAFRAFPPCYFIIVRFEKSSSLLVSADYLF